MTYQEILEGITKHRLNLVQLRTDFPYHNVVGESLRKKIEEIEGALQALTEKLRDEENIQKHQSFGPAIGLPYWKDR